MAAEEMLPQPPSARPMQWLAAPRTDYQSRPVNSWLTRACTVAERRRGSACVERLVTSAGGSSGYLPIQTRRTFRPEAPRPMSVQMRQYPLLNFTDPGEVRVCWYGSRKAERQRANCEENFLHSHSPCVTPFCRRPEPTWRGPREFRDITRELVAAQIAARAPSNNLLHCARIDQKKCFRSNNPLPDCAYGGSTRRG